MTPHTPDTDSPHASCCGASQQQGTEAPPRPRAPVAVVWRTEDGHNVLLVAPVVAFHDLQPAATRSSSPAGQGQVRMNGTWGQQQGPPVPTLGTPVCPAPRELARRQPAHQLVRARDKREPVGVVELLADVLAKGVACGAEGRRDGHGEGRCIRRLLGCGMVPSGAARWNRRRPGLRSAPMHRAALSPRAAPCPAHLRRAARCPSRSGRLGRTTAGRT